MKLCHMDVSQYTVGCYYNAAQYLYMALQWLKQNIYQKLNSQKTPHISPSRVIYGVSIVSI